MQYEILAYSARYDARKGRLTYWDVCSDKPTGRRDTDFEFLNYVNTDDDALLETPYSYGRGYGRDNLQFLADRFTLRTFYRRHGSRWDAIVCIIRRDFNRHSAVVGEQCVGRCDVTITPAGVMLHVIEPGDADE